MICNRCLRTAIQRPCIVLPFRRALTTTSALQTTTPPAATSTGAAQPFSTPLTPSPSAANLQAPSAEKQAPTVKSSVAAGTPLKGLNFLKGKNDPVAMEDSEYPSWLWSILSKKKKGVAEGGSAADASSAEGDLFSKSKKQRRNAAKAIRKQQLMNPEALAPKVPLYEQTIDLPAGDGSLQGAIDAMNARDALTKAMRKERRSKIKEANFLKAMG